MTWLRQSEAATAVECGRRWWAIWRLGHKPPKRWSPPLRIGTLGHAFVERAFNVCGDPGFEDHDPLAWLRDTCDKWFISGILQNERAVAGEGIMWGTWDVPPDWVVDEVQQAHRAALDVVSLLRGRVPVRLPDGRVLCEHELRVTWDDVERMTGRPIPPLVRATYAGAEGRVDLVDEPAAWGPHAQNVVSRDHKFRQAMPEQVVAPENTSRVPDPQLCWYDVLLRSVGVHPHEHRQVEVYAGPYLRADDFGWGSEDNPNPLVTSDGLPRQVRNISAYDWRTAWEALAFRRLVKKSGPNKGRKWTPTEEADRDAFLRILEAQRTVVERRFAIERSVAVDVFFTRLWAVEERLEALRAGREPAPNLQSHPRSACSRACGCDVQAPCLASLGSGPGKFLAVLRDHAAQGFLATPPASTLGTRPVDGWAPARKDT